MFGYISIAILTIFLVENTLLLIAFGRNFAKVRLASSELPLRCLTQGYPTRSQQSLCHTGLCLHVCMHTHAYIPHMYVRLYTHMFNYVTEFVHKYARNSDHMLCMVSRDVDKHLCQHDAGSETLLVSFKALFSNAFELALSTRAAEFWMLPHSLTLRCKRLSSKYVA